MNEKLFQELRSRLFSRADLQQEISDEELQYLIDEIVTGQDLQAGFSLQEKWEMRRELYRSVRKLGVLEELMQDPGITEIMVNGPDSIFVEKAGTLFAWDRTFSSGEKLEEVVRQIAAKCNRVINETIPIVDARLEDGSRVNAVVAPAALNGPILTIRRFSDTPLSIDTLIRKGSITKEAADFLIELVQAKYTMMIGGGTGSGKTTLLGALADSINEEERVIVMEDNAELRISRLKNLVRLEAKQANLEGGTSITIRDLIKTALRMRPDRLIVGEVRGEESFDLLQACNVGHSGSLCTAHANSTRDMISRLETMVIMGGTLPLDAIRRQIATGIEILIHLGRTPDRSRKVMEITEVIGYENGEIILSPLFEREKSGELIKKKELFHREKREYFHSA